MTNNGAHNPNEGYIKVRGVNIPRQEIEDIEQSYGAKLVPDTEPDLILSLDLTLQKFRLENGRDPEAVVLTDRPGEFFKHAVLNINFMGMSVPGAYNKPAWFRFSKLFIM